MLLVEHRLFIYLHIYNMAKVTGVGGVFLTSKDVEATKSWYAKHLGFAVDEYGTMWDMRTSGAPDQPVYLQWSVMKHDTPYIKPSTENYMVNYRVDDLVSLIAQLRDARVTIVDEMETYDYGKFIHILDIDGRKIELWEPVDSVFSPQ